MNDSVLVSEEILSKKWNTTSARTIIKVIITLVIVLGNGLLATFIVLRRKKILIPNILILSLTMADFLNGSFSGTMLLYMSYHDVSQTFCIVFLVYGALICYASSFNVMIISFDRYVKLKYPIYHRTTMSRLGHRIVLVAAVWIPSLVLAEIRHVLFLNHTGLYLKGCFYRNHYIVYEQLEPTIVMVTANIVSLIIYIKIVFHVNSVPKPDCDSNTHIDSWKLRKHIGQYKPDLVQTSPCPKVSLVLGFIVLFNFIFVAGPPMAFTVSVLLYSNQSSAEPSESYIEMISWWFLTSSAVNPFIFALMNRQFNNYLKSLFCDPKTNKTITFNLSSASKINKKIVTIT